MQISIEALANLANHLAAQLGWEAPRSYTAAFANLSRYQVVQDPELAARLD